MELRLSPELEAEEFVKLFADSYGAGAELQHRLFDIVASPFKCARIRGLVDGEAAIDSVAKATERLKWTERSSDLHQFAQSDDLGACGDAQLRLCREFFLSRALPWLQRLLRLQLDPESIDVTCSRYLAGDTLLCHDDRVEGRRVAFVWYLVPADWRQEDGGCLDLLRTDARNRPVAVGRSLLPQRNSLVLFEVSRASYHQVAEVTSSSRSRLSVHGWFRFPPGHPDAAALVADSPSPSDADVRPRLSPPVSADEELVLRWTNPQYLEPDTQARVRDAFGDESQICLDSFLNEELVSELLGQLREAANWSPIGPMSSRCYDVIADDKPPLAAELDRLFRSDAFLVIVSDLTGLRLHPASGHHHQLQQEEGEEEKKEKEEQKKKNKGEEEEEDSGRSSPEAKRARSSAEPPPPPTWNDAEIGACGGEFRRWRRGCYSLLRDCDFSGAGEFRLEATWYCGCGGWRAAMGGGTHYAASDSSEELLSVQPSDNSLNLVYCDSETAPFVKFVNSGVAQLNSAGAFFDYRGVYCEP